MGAAWFAILAVMLTVYAVLDGFAFGAGIMHLFVARTDAERRQVFAALEPVWDGNEVWLVAAGGAFVFAFPRVYAAAFSGLYLPLMMVLWLLILRGVSIKVRSQLDEPLWSAGWDAVFAVASASMAIVLGVALGNVVRGVPLDATGYFEADLFSFSGSRVGAIDWYTALLGFFALATLGAHGGTYLALKTQGVVQARARTTGARCWVVALVLAAVATGVTATTQSRFFASALARPWIWPLPLAAIVAGVMSRRWLVDGRDRLDQRAFFASCAFIALFLLATASALFPVMLRSTIDEAFTLGVGDATSRGLGVGAIVWTVGVALVLGYLAFVLRTFRGKVEGHE
ncbi:MAG: cytochrome d ubiquinol oxidase subunit II [Polyangiaceae bacterium]